MITIPPIVSPKPVPIIQPPLYVCPFQVAVDTREQAPWHFSNQIMGGRLWIIKREVRTLATGDYSIVGHEQEIVVERKSVDDALSSITAGNERFRREHERMAEIVEAGGFAAVVVEGDLATICEDLDSGRAGRQISSDVVIGVAASWSQRYGTHWVFAGSRALAERLAFRFLLKWWQENEREVE